MHHAGTVGRLGTAQTLAWASSYYLPAIVAVPVAADLGTSPALVFGAFSMALVVAALLGPHAGRAIDRWGGRPVLATSSLVFAAGLVLLAATHGPLLLFAAWALLGVGMACGLYEAAFASLVRLQGADARAAITGITLVAGFASTVGWPLTTFLAQHLGWRGACLAWATAHLVLGLPLNLSLPRLAAARSHASAVHPDAPAPPRATSLLLAFVFATTWFVGTAMAAHLPRLLQAAGTTLAAAVAAGALVGPAQVAARLLEFGLLRRLHPLLSTRLAAALHPAGVLALFALGPAGAIPFVLLHGGGNGILTISKGTLPLALFGPQGYGHRQGLLMVPARFAQAAAPWLFGLALQRWGAGALLLSSGLSLAALAALAGLHTPGATRTAEAGPAPG